MGWSSEGLRSFPLLLGEPGQVGQPGPVDRSVLPSPAAFHTLTPGRREELSRDWQTGQQVLVAYGNVLRQEARNLHKRTLLQRLGRSVRTTIADKPGRLLIVVAVLALNVAICRTYILPWLEDRSWPTVMKVISPTPRRNPTGKKP